MSGRSKKRAALTVVAITGWLLIAIAGSGQGKEFEYPSGRIGEIAEAYVRMFSSADDSLASKFYYNYLSPAAMEEHPLKDQLWRYHHLHELLGVITPLSVVENKETGLVMLVKSEAIESYFHVGLELDGEKPPKLKDFYIRPAPRPK